jgi:peptide chain release factor 1
VDGGHFDVAVVEELPGYCALHITGKKALETFKDEPGGHRWQRVPPNEKRGRVHTSTITVAVLPEPTAVQVILREGDLEFSACRGSGNGGQHRNVTDSAVILKHKPSGIQIRCEAERSQLQNKETARAMLRAKLWQAEQEKTTGARADERKRQIGSGMRGDKRRTIRTQDDVVNDHETGKQWRFKDYVRGNW